MEQREGRGEQACEGDPDSESIWEMRSLRTEPEGTTSWTQETREREEREYLASCFELSVML